MAVSTLVAFNAQAADVECLAARADIRFAATSTLHDFGGAVAALPFGLQLSNRTWAAEADVPGGCLATGSAGRDRNLYKMINTNAYPYLHGQVTGAYIPANDGSTNLTLVMKIRDCTCSLPVRISRWRETPKEVSFHAAWTVSLKQFGLKPPSVLGLIRVGDAVRIEAEVTATRTNSIVTAVSGDPPP